MRSLLPGLAALLLAAGCASAPPLVSGLLERSKVRDFGLEARFALRLTRPDAAAQSASGRISWLHAGGADHILIADPLGQGIAEIDRSADCSPARLCAELRTGDGKLRRAADPARLVLEATGYPLPLGDLPAWLLGRPAAAGKVETDSAGRPKRLADSGWQIEYDYDSEAAEALPSRLTLRRDAQPGEIELRLRIEEWRNPQ